MKNIWYHLPESCLELNSVGAKRKVLSGFVKTAGRNLFTLQIEEDLTPRA